VLFIEDGLLGIEHEVIGSAHVCLHCVGEHTVSDSDPPVQGWMRNMLWLVNLWM
jgi:hypothetical protein